MNMNLHHMYRAHYRKRNTILSREDKIKLIQLALENPNLKQKEIGDVFGVERSSVAKILKRKNEFLPPGSEGLYAERHKRARSEQVSVLHAFDVQWMEVEHVVYTWYLTCTAEHQQLTDIEIMEKAQQVAVKFGVSAFVASPEWLKGFKERYRVYQNGSVTVPFNNSTNSFSNSSQRNGGHMPWEIHDGRNGSSDIDIDNLGSTFREAPATGQSHAMDHITNMSSNFELSTPAPSQHRRVVMMPRKRVESTSASNHQGFGGRHSTKHLGLSSDPPLNPVDGNDGCYQMASELHNHDSQTKTSAGKTGTGATSQNADTRITETTYSTNTISTTETHKADVTFGSSHSLLTSQPSSPSLSESQQNSQSKSSRHPSQIPEIVITIKESPLSSPGGNTSNGRNSATVDAEPQSFLVDIEAMAEVSLDQMISQDISNNADLLDSPTSGMHRIQSESHIQENKDGNDARRNDPYKALERSQSDAYLLRNSPEPEEEIPSRLGSQDTGSISNSRNVSECSRVYMDLSRAEPFERVEFSDSTVCMFRSSSGRQLETIPQDEELKMGDLSHLYARNRSFSNESSSSLEDMTSYSKVKTKEVTSSMKYVKTSKSHDIGKTKTNLKSSFQIYSHTLKQKIRTLQMGSIPEQVNALEEVNVLMEQAWSMPVYGKDLAYSLCDILRAEKALDIIISNLTSSNRDLLKTSARLLEQALTTHNRKQIAENGLEAVVKMTRDYQGDVELASTMTGILESLFKTSEETCSKVIKLGGLDVIIYWCRCNDRVVLKHCAIALSNLSLYGGPDNQQEMTKHKVPEWLFPLAFIDDDSIRYYACLAIAVLVSNKEIEAAVLKSGTLRLVRPFVDSHDPQEFAQMDISHQHGRSSDWLRRLVPILTSKREEAQALGAFHMAMEAGIKAEQDRKEVLYDIGAVEPLRWLASTPNSTASRLAGQALRILGEEVPHKLSQQVPLWTTEDVAHWVSQVGFGDYSEGFRSCQVDGDLLLRLTEDELMDSIEMGCGITRKRFLRELKDLKISADYTSCDPTKLGDWLVEVGPEFAQYTYQMIHSGVDKQTLRSLSHDHLANDCAVLNGIHRMKILNKIEELRSVVASPTAERSDSVDGEVCMKKKPIDVFISYRRSNGSQLASLLKVHLQLRGFTVFIDIERLRAGKFDESLLQSVRQANHFIIVLTPNALDRCMDDHDKQDWVHREIVAAIESGVNIIPLFDNFHWPPTERLPEDIRNLAFFNGVRWIHDYQDACVDKLERFLRGEADPSVRGGPLSASSRGSVDGLGSPPAFPRLCNSPGLMDKKTAEAKAPSSSGSVSDS